MSKRRSQQKINQAVEFWDNDQNESAIQLLSKIIAESDDLDEQAEALMYKGWVLEEEKRIDEAIKCFDLALTNSTDRFVTAYSHQGYGSCLLDRDDFLKAAEHFKKAHALYVLLQGKEYQNYLWSCTSLLFYSLTKADMLKEAIEFSERLEKNKMPAWFRVDVFINSGHYFYRKSLFNEAIPHYENALKYAKEDDRKSEILAYLGSAYHQVGEKGKSIPMLKKALKITRADEIKGMCLKYLECS